jgi:hypothetical protein
MPSVDRRNKPAFIGFYCLSYMKLHRAFGLFVFVFVCDSSTNEGTTRKNERTKQSGLLLSFVCGLWLMAVAVAVPCTGAGKKKAR